MLLSRPPLSPEPRHAWATAGATGRAGCLPIPTHRAELPTGRADAAMPPAFDMDEGVKTT